MNKAKEHIKEIHNLVKELATETDKVKLSEKFKEYLNFMAKFHNYSWYNTFWIMAQNPKAERVAGFRKWNELKRTIRKGEHGIKILYPMRKETEKINTNGETETQEYIYFNVGYVFDISQTEGRELPTIESPSVEGDNYYFLLDVLRQFCNDNNITLEFKQLLQNSLYGYTRKDKEEIIITIKEQDNKNTQAQTLIHEICHSLEH
ncbi:MAG: ArdC family protein, partial [Nanoarchaeota archaeon]